MAKLSEETIRKMRAVIAAVKREPKFYDQRQFPQEHDCGQTCCAAGWAVWLDDPTRYLRLVQQHSNSSWWAAEADRLLGTPPYSGLWGTGAGWPYPFASRLAFAFTPAERAKAMADRWEHYIKTDGAE